MYIGFGGFCDVCSGVLGWGQGGNGETKALYRVLLEVTLCGRGV